MEDELKRKREKERSSCEQRETDGWKSSMFHKKNFNLRGTDSQKVDVRSHVVSAFHILNLQDQLHEL